MYRNGKLTAGFNHGVEDLSEAYFGATVANHIELLWVDCPRATSMSSPSFTNPMPEMDPEDGRLWQVYKAAGRAVKEKEAKVFARRMAGIILERLTHDVRLFFPHAHENGAELSGLVETVPHRSKRARTDGVIEQVALPPAEKDFEDSDDETDTFLFSKRPPTLDDSSERQDYLYRQISNPQTAFSTDSATLLYLQTCYISFLPLTSSGSPESRIEYLDKAFADNPSLPLPVSPKSVYRLAHLLSLDDLQNLALTAFKNSLSAKTPRRSFSAMRRSRTTTFER
ncbi:hypothetical protein JCM8547_000488 [Rhodosporidiobolus lusitaniae]